MEGDNVIFVGHFSRVGAIKNPAASIAGDLVQSQIIRESNQLIGKAFHFISMEPCACWPKGPLWVRGQRVSDRGYFPFLVNIPLLKNFLFAVSIFFYCLKVRPKVVVQYNSYLFENVAILLVKLFLKIKTVLIIQDFRVGDAFKGLSGAYDRISNYFARFFDLAIPVSKKLACDIGLREGRFVLFLGGVTEPGIDMLKFEKYENNYAVFAGALESYNGIDKLISAWSDYSLDLKLHVFGKGSLAQMVLEESERNENIIYHGYQSQEEVATWQSAAKFNFCLRYSSGLEEEYFFPSKIFNIACCPGLLIVNDFKNIPDYFSDCCGLVRSDLSNLLSIIELDDNEIKICMSKRRGAVLRENSWKKVLNYIYSDRD